MTIEIPLTKNQVAIVDSVDSDLAVLKWRAQGHSKRNGFYAVRTAQQNPRVVELMHRVILERVLGREMMRNEEVDHINGSKLDNRRSNLRLATIAQNQHNAGLRKDNTSGYKGVSWSKHHSKWVAGIYVNCKRIHLGMFSTPEEAYEAYKAAARNYFGEFARFD